jgi:O-antigen/teichoic acid export membrane protein
VLFEGTKVAVAIVLARLLTPHEYGLAGMVLVLVAFQPVLSGTALASVLVQRRSLTEADRSTVFWVNAATGLACSLAGLLLAGPAARLYGDPQVRPLFAAMSACFFVSALGITHSHLLMREMDFKALELRTMAGVVVGALVAILLAARGYGAWALVGQQIATFATGTVLLWTFSSWHPRLRFSRASLREMRRFGGHVSGTMLMTQLTQNTDNVLIGRYLGAAPLGAYALAYNVILVPFSRLTAPLFEVLYPVFSRLQDDRDRLAAVWLRVTRVLVALALPAMLGLVVVADDVVTAVLGSKWHAAGPVIQILAWVGVLVALQGLNSLLLQALGRTRLLLRFSYVLFGAGLVAFVVGLRWGIVGVAACFAAVSTVVQPAYLHLTARALGLGSLACLRALAGVLAATALMVAFALALRAALIADGLGAAPRLALVVATSAAVYGGAVLLLAGDVVGEVEAFVRRRA